MPSNALKISQFIEQLQELLAAHGDIDMTFVVPVDNNIIAIDGRNVNVATQVLAQTLQRPVVAIGLWRDELGRLRNMPGALYVTSDEGDGWNYNRAEAPGNCDLEVWKRYATNGSAKDIGKRVGDKWFVREGAAEWPARPVEISPSGVMAWRLP